MALFAREGGLNSALQALSRSPDPKAHACRTNARTRNLASRLRAALGQCAPTPRVRPARSFLVDSYRVTSDLYRDRSAIGISRSLQIHLCSRTNRVHCTSSIKSASTIHLRSAIGYFPLTGYLEAECSIGENRLCNESRRAAQAFR